MHNIKSVLKKVGCLSLATALVFMGGCSKKPSETDKKNPLSETRPFTMAISTPDGVFNPFFSTSAFDSSVTAHTQISMLTSTPKGEPACGDDQPVVVKDWTSSYDSKTDKTTYKFIIKNGIKFSDGSDLTIKDVLFNLYVYLDPVYTGSYTIYSTDIVGLANYRTQQTGNQTSTSMSAWEETFFAEANDHIKELIDYVYFAGIDYSTDKVEDRWTEDEKEVLEKDFTRVAEEFRKELESDWNSCAESKDSYKDWGFTETWQIFLFQDGGYTELLKKNPDGSFVKDENGNYKLDETESNNVYQDYKDYIKENKLGDSEESKRIWAIESVYMGKFGDKLETTQATNFEEVITQWATAETMLNLFATEAKSDYFGSTDKIVPTVSGITTHKTDSDYHGNKLSESHDVLQIVINGVDPKAIWNFSFVVAPMAYYSTHDYNGKDYINSFNAEKGEFGFKFGDSKFMNDVLNSTEKNGLPLGAGPYRASSINGGPAKNKGEFFNNNYVFYERNEYFTTLGSGIENAKIKYMRYKVVETDQIMNSIITREIDYGEPNATQDNRNELAKEGVTNVTIQTNGYGYVGINPRYVPNINVRRAIIKAMDRSIITNNYYQGGLAEIIERPMSKASWAYPDGATTYISKNNTSYQYDSTGVEIERLVQDAGYVKNSDGIYEKTYDKFGVDKLEYTFTIAGASSDHPAMKMFESAATLLNKHGFHIKVVTSQTALSDLANGKLTVWAAAWTSSIDPDMYQVYHKDSKATSVSNWGYRQIRNNTTLYSTEWQIIQDLSVLIDEGRHTDDQSEREGIYKDALDLVMELAVEFPTYQRYDMSAFYENTLNINTMTPERDRTPTNGLLARIWELDYNPNFKG